MPLMFLINTFLAAFLTSLVMIPPISNLAVKIGGIDIPEDRKVHETETPRLGGIAIFFALFLPLIFFGEIEGQLKGVLAGATIAFLVGLADDLMVLTPKKKLIGQITAAAAVVFIGKVSLTSLGDPFGMGEIPLGIMSVPFTMFALVGIMNAINLLDGLDGLAGGVSAIACVVFLGLSFETGNQGLLCMTTALLGGIVGFLNYNTYPAKIFMGDAGSMLLGYMLGTLSIILVSGSGGKISPFIPVIVLAVPLLDTITVMTNRLRKGKSIFNPDRTHLHHRLLDLGIGHKMTVILVYGLTYILSAFAIIGHRYEDYFLAISLMAIFIVIYSSLNCLSRYGSIKKVVFIKSNQPIKETDFYQRVIRLSNFLPIFIKYLLGTFFFIGIFIPSGNDYVSSVISFCLIVLTVSLLFTKSLRGNQFLFLTLYLSGVFIVFQLENLGMKAYLIGIPVSTISDCIFLFLLAIVGVKIFLKKRTELLTASPLEYLVFFLSLSIPLLPGEITSTYHLQTVACKSIILLFAFKLVLIIQMKRNRMILLVTILALSSVAIRHFVG